MPMNYRISQFVYFVNFSLLSLTASAQEQWGDRVMLASSGINKVRFHLYQPVFAAKATYVNLEEVTNTYPEQLMSSLLSESSQEWTNLNTLGGEQNAEHKQSDYYESVTRMNKVNNYFELRCKLMFVANGEEFAIVKFYLISQNNSSMCGAYVMQRVNNKWYKTSNTLTTPLSLWLMTFDEKKLAILFQPNTSSSPLINALRKQITLNGQLSLEKLISVSDGWSVAKNKIERDYFLDKQSWLNK